MAGQQKFYEEGDAEEILRLAAGKGIGSGSMSHDELVRAAAELGISPDVVASAAQEYQKGRVGAVDRAEYDKYRKRALYDSIGKYLSVNLMLFAINFVASRGHWWFIWPAGFMLIPVIKEVVSFYYRGSGDYERGFERWKAKRDRKDVQQTDVRKELDAIAGYVDIDAEKLKAIKELRERTGLGLKESKEAVDAYLGDPY
ncbi:hypothetical protein BH11ARM1_BH11ARM1_10770 [soil metagenome]